MKRSIVSWIVVMLIAALSAPVYANDALMDLLKVLKDKGSLTDTEYNALREAAAGEAKKESAMASAGGRSDWTDTIKLKGDMRLRYQTQSQDGAPDRGRGRLRYRLGIIAEPADRLEVGAGLASGGSDPRSTNQTFDNTFSSKGINLDYAYAQYRLNDYVKAISGKFKIGDYLYKSTDLMWDGDINPEGVSAHFDAPNAMGKAFANAGIWVLQENSGSSNDPYMFYAQIGQKFESGNVFGTFAGTYYSFEEINALADYSSSGSNTDYHFGGVYSIAGELGLRDALGKGVRTSLIGEWVGNGDTNTSQDSGYAIGLKASKNAWSFKYLYADLETNAWPDILPDSDRFDGLTGIDGHEFAVEYALAKHVVLGLDYYNVDNNANVNQDLLQLDVMMKF